MDEHESGDDGAGIRGLTHTEEPPVVLHPHVLDPRANRWFLARLVVFFTVFFFCLLCNVFLPMLFWHRRPLGNWQEPLAFVAVGGLVSQLAILSIWCAIGPTVFKWRFLVTAGLSVLVSTSYIVGLQVPDYPDSSMPFYVGVFILVSGLAGFFLSAASVGLLSLMTGERIVDSEKNPEPGGKAASYSIGYLIGLTTAVALIVAGVRGAMPETIDRRPPASEIVVFGLLTFQHAVFTVLLIYSAVLMILRRRKNWVGCLWLVLLVIVALPANLLLMSQHRGMRLDGEIVLNMVFYTAGVLATVALQLLLIRFLGYRLDTRGT